MARYWSVKAEQTIQEIVEERSFAGIGWKEADNLTGLSREQIAARVEECYPDYHPSRRHQTTGMLYRFASEITEGDVVLTPIKATRRVLFGRVAGPYRFNPKPPLEHETHTRPVQWLRTDVSRDDLSTAFRNSLGGLMTVYNLDGHADEIERVIRGESGKASGLLEDERNGQSDAQHAAEEESAALERISDLLYSKFDHHEFEELVAAVLTAMGYRTRGRFRPGADGGKDIIATKDAIDPEGIKVEVKHRIGAAGRPDIQKLKGALSGNERGLFVSLGGFTNDAIRENIAGVRLMDGDDFIKLLLEYYDRVDVQWQARLPLKRVYLPAGEL